MGFPFFFLFTDALFEYIRESSKPKEIIQMSIWTMNFENSPSAIYHCIKEQYQFVVYYDDKSQEDGFSGRYYCCNHEDLNHFVGDEITITFINKNV